MIDGTRCQCFAFLLAGLAAGCGGGGGPGIVNAPSVTAVSISRPNADPIDIGGTVQLTADVQVQNGAAQTVDWSSSTPNVASVSTSGLVTGVGAGQTTITATSTVNRTRTASVSVTVNSPRVVGVTLNSTAKTIKAGESFALTATVDTRGPLARTVSFTSSNIAVAAVSSADGLTATVAGVAVGQATITATSTADALKNASLPVTVTGTVRITSVNPSTVNIRSNTSVKLVPTVQADAGLSAAVTYQSLNTSTASVAADGTVTGIAIGQTGIVVRSVGDPTVSVTVPVTVRSGVTSVSLTPDRDSLRPGSTHQLTTAVVAESGVSTAVSYSSANPAIATINASGVVTATAVGQAYVRALSAIDPNVGDSTLVFVVSPCSFYPAIAIGGAPVNGTVNDASCNGTTELFSTILTAQTSYSLSLTPQFPANMAVIGDKTGAFIFSPNTGQQATVFITASPGRYYEAVGPQNAAVRGSFSIATTLNPSLANVCNIVATTGVTMLVPLNTCGFTPQNRPAGTYASFGIQVLPVLQVNDRLTLTITTPTPIFGLVEMRFESNPPIQVIATGTSLVQTFTAPVVTHPYFIISTRDANQFGNVSVRIDGPPTIPFDSFIFGAGILTNADRMTPPRSAAWRTTPLAAPQFIRR